MKFNRLSSRPLATFAAGLFVLVACQNATEPTNNSGPVTATASYNMGSSSRLPDSVTWTAPKESGSHQTRCKSLVCYDTFQISEPLGADSLTVQLWTLGIRTSTIYFGEQGNSPTLVQKSTVRRDTLDDSLLSKFDALTTAQKTPFSALGQGASSLVAYYASLILAGDTAVVGKAAPMGMSADSIKKDLVYLADKQGLTAIQLVAKKLLPGLDSVTVVLDVKILIKAGVLNSTDSAAIFPPYPVWVTKPISVNGILTAGGSAVSVSGAFAWTKGKIVSPKFEVHTSKGVDPAFNFTTSALPSSTAIAWALDSNLTIQANAAASIGTDTLVVTLTSDSGYAAISRATFQVLAKDTTAPSLKILSPSSDTTVPNATGSILVTAIASDSGSGLDSVKIGTSKHTSSPFSDSVLLAVGTNPIVVQAWDKAGNRTVDTVTLTRAKALGDTTVPKVVRVSPSKDTIVAWSTKTIQLSWTITDDSVLARVTLNDSVLTGMGGSTLYQKTVALGSGLNTFILLALDGHGNSKRDTIHVTRFADTTKSLLTVTPLTDTARLVEDSLTSLSFRVQNFVGSSLTIRFTPKDSTLVSRRTWTLVPDASGMVSIPLQGKLNAFGGPITCSLQFADSLDSTNLSLPLTVAARNHPPAFGGMANLVVSSNAAPHTFPGWIDSIFAGATNESYQKVSFQLQVLNGGSLFASVPVVDSTGALSFAGKANSSGPALVQVRAVDNDSVDPGSRYSPWRTATIYFNTSPTLTLSTHTASTFPGVPVSNVAATIFDLETSANNLVVSWTVSDSTVLPHDNVLVQQTGGSRNIQLTPIHSGNASVVFTITDSLGATGKDSLALTVSQINHAPIFQLTKTVYSLQNYNRDSLIANFVSILSAADSLQYIVSRRVDVLGIPLDSAFTAAPTLDAQGTLHLPRKPNLTGSITLRITVKDNGGTASGGVDTAFADVKLYFSDTIVDPADGQVYHYLVLGNRSWFAQNLRRQPKWGTVNSDSNGVLYHWAQGFDQDSAKCDDSACAMTLNTYAAQGLCPTGWNIPMDQEWKNLVKWADNGLPDSVGSSRLRSKTGWTWFVGLGSIINASGTDDWGFGVKKDYCAGCFTGQGSWDARFWSNTLSPDSTGGTLGRVFADFTPTGFSVWGLYAAQFDLWFPIRCVKTLPPGQW